MKVREWLERVRKLDELIDAKLAEREQLRAMATKVVSDMDGMPHAKGGVSDPVGSNVVKIIALAEEADKLVDQYVEHKQNVIKALERLPEREYAVLHKHYIQYKTWEEIADEMGYCTMQIWRFKRNAMIHLEDVIECYTTDVV